MVSLSMTRPINSFASLTEARTVLQLLQRNVQWSSGSSPSPPPAGTCQKHRPRRECHSQGCEKKLLEQHNCTCLSFSPLFSPSSRWILVCTCRCKPTKSWTLLWKRTGLNAMRLIHFHMASIVNHWWLLFIGHGHHSMKYSSLQRWLLRVEQVDLSLDKAPPPNRERL